MSPVAFGIFDHLDRADEPLGQMYESRLRMVEAADAAGFRTYHVAEHHATPLGMAPSPNVYLAAVAQRTRRIRFGPLIYILPLYEPIRLIEEICMLDHLSGGRLELGVGRGISPYELAYFNVDFLRGPAMYEEALAVVLKGLAGGPLTYDGRYYRYAGVPMELEPVQRPHPPLWQGVVSPDTAGAAARRNVNVVCNLGSAALEPVVQAYWKAWDRDDGAPKPLVGAQRHVYIADTDAEAVATARGAYQRWYDNLTHLWRKFGTLPARFAPTLERAIETDAAIVGSAATVRREVQRHVATSGVNYFVGRFMFGDLPVDRAIASMQTFAREVIPEIPTNT